jgi:ubiquinone/menaquinone biosynthesis C-methylase UbiE
MSPTTTTTTGADLRSFADVDGSDNPQALFRSLDVGRATNGMRQAEAEIMRRLRLDSARRVLDLGCGLGDDARAMAGAMPAAGTVVGVDLSRLMVDEARRRTAATAAADRIEFLVAPATDVPLPAGSFDRCRAQAIMQHVPDARGVVAETARLLRPGGVAVALEFDLGSTVVDHPDRATTRRILDGVTDAALDGWIGRQLPRLFREAGFVDVEAAPQMVFNDFEFFSFTLRRPLAQLVKDQLVTGREAVRWMSTLENMHRDGHFLAGSLAFVVSAVRGGD